MDDDDLLAQTPARPEAFVSFYRRHERALLGFFVRRTGDPELAADLAAETFATVLLRARKFDPARGSALAWTFGIAQNLLQRAWERRRVEDRARRRLGMPPVVLEDEALERIERLGGDERVVALLEQLPPDQAHAVRSRVIDEQPYPRIAADVRCSESVVRKRVSRGLTTLRSIMKEQP